MSEIIDQGFGRQNNGYDRRTDQQVFEDLKKWYAHYLHYLIRDTKHLLSEIAQKDIGTPITVAILILNRDNCTRCCNLNLCDGKRSCLYFWLNPTSERFCFNQLAKTGNFDPILGLISQSGDQMLIDTYRYLCREYLMSHWQELKQEMCRLACNSFCDCPCFDQIDLYCEHYLLGNEICNDLKKLLNENYFPNP